MDTMTIVIAAIAALAILLIAFGVAMSGGSSDVNARLARYASTREEKPETAGGSQGTGQGVIRTPGTPVVPGTPVTLGAKPVLLGQGVAP